MANTPNEHPREYFTPLQVVAFQLHEAFSTFVNAGFSEEQSMQILVEMTNFSINFGNNDSEDYD